MANPLQSALEQVPFPEIEISRSMYELLFEWLPTVTESCEAGPCLVPVEGAVTYAAIILAVIGAGAIFLLALSSILSGGGTAADEPSDEPSDESSDESSDDATSDSELDDVEDPADSFDGLDDPAEMMEDIDSSVEYNPPTDDDISDPIAEAVLDSKKEAQEGHSQAQAEDQDTDGELDLDEEMDISRESDLAQRSLAPSGVSREFYTARVGKKYRRVLFAEEWPSPLQSSPLVHVFNDPTLRFDMSIHFGTMNRRRAIRKAEKRADNLRAQAKVQEQGAGSGAKYAANDKAQRAAALEEIRESMKDGSQPFETSMYVSLKADDKETLEKQEKRLVSKMQDSPGGIGLTTLRGRPIQGLQSVAPLGKDTVRMDTDIDTSHIVFGGGVGALLASMSVSSEMNKNGIEIGEHVTNGMPLIRDPFDSETNYNQVIIGDSGAGKSYNIKLQAIREAARTDDRMIIMLDPLRGFHGLAAALDAKHILVGGEKGFNPLEIDRPTDEAIERTNEEFSALKTKVQSVLNFFENYFSTQGIETGIGDKKLILSKSLYEAYGDAGITDDPRTHGNPSPTIVDVRQKLEAYANDGSVFNPATEEEKDKIEETAARLHTMLRPFVDGEYENLGKNSDIEISGEDFIYVDLSPQESSEGGGSGLMMQLLFQILYEQAKTTPKEVIFIIDEAQFMLKEGESLEFLSQRVRHARHFNMSIRFATQNVKDFMRTDEATDIINNAYLTIYHRTNEIHEFKEELEIIDAHANFIRSARSGKNYDHSHALFHINQDFYPVQISSNPAEHAVISFDPDEDLKEDLPGYDKAQSPLSAQIERNLINYTKQVEEASGPLEPPLKGTRLANSALALSEAQRNGLQLIGWENQARALKRIEDGEDPNDVIGDYIDNKVQQMVAAIGTDRLKDILLNDDDEVINELRPEHEPPGANSESGLQGEQSETPITDGSGETDQSE